MKKFILTLILTLFICGKASAIELSNLKFANLINNDNRQITSVLKAQVRYANKTNLEKFISTYDESYLNGDGFDLETYSKLVKELWETYTNLRYEVKIENIEIDENGIAHVKLIETSTASIPIANKMDGMLKSVANSEYRLKKINGKWKVISDVVINENTSMLYGEAMNLDIKFSAPKEVEPGYEYTASLEFVPPKDTFAIASIAKDKVEYPQKQAKEVFRKMPEDNILERLFVANTDNANEYIIASIGLTKADIQEMSIKLSMTGFGYKIIRVNVLPKNCGDDNGQDK